MKKSWLKSKLNLTIRKKQLELIPAIYALLWGIWVLNPSWNSFESQTFHLMSNFASEWIWGIAVGIIGLFQITVVFLNNLKLRAFASLLTMFTFVTMSVFVVFSSIRSTAIPSYITVALCAWLAYIEIASDVREEKTCK